MQSIIFMKVALKISKAGFSFPEIESLIQFLASLETFKPKEFASFEFRKEIARIDLNPSEHFDNVRHASFQVIKVMAVMEP
jgi:hypothetical protein